MAIFRRVLPSLLALTLVGCGVKGDPIPYVQTHPREKEAATVKPAATPTPSPAKKESGR